MNKPELIVMLTHNDYTVKNAVEVFEACKHTPVNYWGAKEQGVPPEELKRLYAAIKASNKIGVLEVVAYSEEACLEGARLAVECGCDILVGTVFFDSVNELCRTNNLKYMPFVGKVSQRPSVLEGTVEEMCEEAQNYLKKGVNGFDLLGYRYCGNGFELSREFINKTNAPICLAGGINSYGRLDEVKRISPDFFTVGSAFFENVFGDDMAKQIEEVYRYLNE